MLLQQLKLPLIIVKHLDDVVIDMYCWRKHGHNESDEPAFTQPVLYKQISQMPNISETFGNQLLDNEGFTENDLYNIKQAYLDKLENAFSTVSEQNLKRKDPFQNLQKNNLLIHLKSIIQKLKKYLASYC